MDIIIWLLKAVTSKVLSDELGAACPSLAQWLVKRSASQLLEDKERYEEQWLADLADQRTPLRKLLFALGIVRAAWSQNRTIAAVAKKPAPMRTQIRVQLSAQIRLLKAHRDAQRAAMNVSEVVSVVIKKLAESASDKKDDDVGKSG